MAVALATTVVLVGVVLGALALEHATGDHGPVLEMDVHVEVAVALLVGDREGAGAALGGGVARRTGLQRPVREARVRSRVGDRAAGRAGVALGRGLVDVPEVRLAGLEAFMWSVTWSCLRPSTR
jgi:hypothetical protein